MDEFHRSCKEESEEGWKTAHDEEGKPYYWRPRETQTHEEWRTAYNEHGRPYSWNTRTREVRWAESAEDQEFKDDTAREPSKKKRRVSTEDETVSFSQEEDKKLRAMHAHCHGNWMMTAFLLNQDLEVGGGRLWCPDQCKARYAELEQDGAGAEPSFSRHQGVSSCSPGALIVHQEAMASVYQQQLVCKIELQQCHNSLRIPDVHLSHEKALIAGRLRLGVPCAARSVVFTPRQIISLREAGHRRPPTHARAVYPGGAEESRSAAMVRAFLRSFIQKHPHFVVPVREILSRSDWNTQKKVSLIVQLFNFQ